MQLAYGTELASGSLICDPKRTKPFRHCECRTYLPIQQRNQPPLLLLRVTIARQNLWIEETGMSRTDCREKARCFYPCCQCLVESSSSPRSLCARIAP